jgi:hypothetical protein
MNVFRAIDTSRPFGYDQAMLSGILLDSRRLNARDGITGAVICRADIDLQWLEGPEDKVRATLDRIRRDDRHLDLRLHVETPSIARVFGEWAMLHDPAPSWIWSAAEVADGAPARATAHEVTAFFLKLREANPAPAKG